MRVLYHYYYEILTTTVDLCPHLFTQMDAGALDHREVQSERRRR